MCFWTWKAIGINYNYKQGGNWNHVLNPLIQSPQSGPSKNSPDADADADVVLPAWDSDNIQASQESCQTPFLGN